MTTYSFRAGERPTTWDLEQGLGAVRWGDDEAAVLTQYPDALQLPGRSFTNPATGARRTVPGSVSVPRFAEEAGGVVLSARLVFDDRGLSELTLEPDAIPCPPGADPVVVAERFAEDLGELLGGRIDRMQEEQTWSVPGGGSVTCWLGTRVAFVVRRDRP